MKRQELLKESNAMRNMGQSMKWIMIAGVVGLLSGTASPITLTARPIIKMPNQ